MIYDSPKCVTFFLFIAHYRIEVKMGQSCRACQTNSQEIKSDPCDLRGPLRDKVQDRMTSSVRQVKEMLVAPNDTPGTAPGLSSNK